MCLGTLGSSRIHSDVFVIRQKSNKIAKTRLVPAVLRQPFSLILIYVDKVAKQAFLYIKHNLSNSLLEDRVAIVQRKHFLVQLSCIHTRSVFEIKLWTNVNFRPQKAFFRRPYVHRFLHQNNVSCLRVFCFSCAENIRVSFYFKIPHWSFSPQPPPTPLLVRYCKLTPASLLACSTE